MANDADQVRTHILLVLNQVLTLATMGIYQKGFAALAAKYPDTHKPSPETNSGDFSRSVCKDVQGRHEACRRDYKDTR